MTGAYGAGGTGPHDAILPAVLPAESRRVAAEDRHVRALLEASGAQVAGTPDVALAVGALPVDVPHRVALLGPTAEPGTRARSLDAFARLAEWTSSTAVAGSLSWSVRGAGWREILRWDIEQRLSAVGVDAGAHRLAERVPRRAAVVVRHSREPWRSLLQAMLAAAEVHPERIIVKEGVLVAIGTDRVARVALRSAWPWLRAENDAISGVRELLPSMAASLIPEPLADVTVGLAAGVVQSRLHGRAPDAPLPAPMWRMCLEMLAHLHAVSGPPLDHQQLVSTGNQAADRLRERGSPSAADAILHLVTDAAEVLVDVPTVWGHGDFWHGNLLAADERVVGIVDWDAAGPGHLPLEDLVQLIAADRGPTGALGYGRALVDVIMPWARAGGDADARDLLSTVGVAPTPELLRALVTGAWARRMAKQLVRYGDRAGRSDWVEVNVIRVAAALRR